MFFRTNEQTGYFGEGVWNCEGSEMYLSPYPLAPFYISPRDEVLFTTMKSEKRVCGSEGEASNRKTAGIHDQRRVLEKRQPLDLTLRKWKDVHLRKGIQP